MYPRYDFIRNSILLITTKTGWFWRIFRKLIQNNGFCRAVIGSEATQTTLDVG